MRTIFLLLSITTILKAQTFQVGHISINFKDPLRSGGYSISGGINMTGTGRNVGTEVYYPAITTGDNMPIVSIGQFPIIVFGHGFAMSWSSYDNIYNRLASLGYIVLLPRTEGGTVFPPPNHEEFGNDLKFVASQGLLLNSVNTPTALTMFNGRVCKIGHWRT